MARQWQINFAETKCEVKAGRCVDVGNWYEHQFFDLWFCRDARGIAEHSEYWHWSIFCGWCNLLQRSVVQNIWNFTFTFGLNVEMCNEIVGQRLDLDILTECCNKLDTHQTRELIFWSKNENDENGRDATTFDSSECVLNANYMNLIYSFIRGVDAKNPWFSVTFVDALRPTVQEETDGTDGTDVNSQFRFTFIRSLKPVPWDSGNSIHEFYRENIVSTTLHNYQNDRIERNALNNFRWSIPLSNSLAAIFK